MATQTHTHATWKITVLPEGTKGTWDCSVTFLNTTREDISTLVWHDFLMIGSSPETVVQLFSSYHPLNCHFKSLVLNNSKYCQAITRFGRSFTPIIRYEYRAVREFAFNKRWNNLTHVVKLVSQVAFGLRQRKATVSLPCVLSSQSPVTFSVGKANMLTNKVCLHSLRMRLLPCLNSD